MDGEIIKEVLLSALQTIIVVSVPILTTYAVKYLNALKLNIQQKSKSEIVDKLVEKAYAYLECAVVETTETYVKSLKQDGNFSVDEQKEAFEKTKQRFEEVVTDEMIDAIKSTTGSYEAWIASMVEQIIAYNK